MRAAILEAAAQILERDGLAGFNTNAVAARAGASIGTLYQYFDDKNAIILAIAQREMAQGMKVATEVLLDEAPADVGSRVRTTIRAVVHAFGGRRRARKAIVQAVFAQGLGEAFLAPIAGFTALLAGRLPSGDAGRADDPAPADLRAFVVSRAILGTIRAAVLEEQPFLASRAFEDELVHLVLSYVGPTDR